MHTLLKSKYATAAEWGAAQSTRLRGWGFTSLMADALGQEGAMPYGIILNVVGAEPSEGIDGAGGEDGDGG